MELLAPFVERRSQARLRETPLRRRGHVAVERPWRNERRQNRADPVDIARVMELNLDRYRDKGGDADVSAKPSLRR
jgi:hypothetical protein